MTSSSTDLSSSKTASRQDEQSYSVLYYKRKNKTHKAKGVVKIDGFLTVETQKSVVTLRNEADNEVIFQGIQSEISKKGILEVDETVRTGAYEVEIVGIVSHNASPSRSSLTMKPAAAAMVATTMKTNRTNMAVVARSTGPALRGPGSESKNSFHPTRRLPSTSTSSSTPNASLGSAPFGKRCLTRKPPAQPVKKAKKCDTFNGSLSDGDEPSATAAASLHKENSATASNNGTFQHTLQPFPAFKRPLQHDVDTNSCTTTSDHILHKKYKPAPSVLPCLPNTNTKHTSSKNVYFHGAAGILDVPHSIKSVLRPHQIDGVTFLWNCLSTATGGKPCHSQKAGGLPIGSNDDSGMNNVNNDRSIRGCILCDGTPNLFGGGNSVRKPIPLTYNSLHFDRYH
jgi:hypothetical protein